MITKARLFPALLGLTSLGLYGCGSIQLASRVERFFGAGDYAAALKVVEEGKKAYSGPDSLLFYFDHGALLQRVGDYSSSIRELEQAELLIEQLYTKSVSESAASFLVNDMSLSYSGEDYEQVMVNVIKALNFLYLGNREGALVEARKVNNKLLALADKYGDQAIYKEDAFALYLSAFTYEWDGDYDDAYIDYKKSMKTYFAYEKAYGKPVPGILKKDLMRMARWLGETQDYKKYRETFGQELPEPPSRPQPNAEVLLVIYDGRIPTKTTTYTKVNLTDPDGEPYVLKVAFPALLPGTPWLSALRLGSPSGQVAESTLVQPLADIARRNLEQRIGLISAKAIARATAKYLASYQLKRATKSSMVGFIANVYTMASEQADTRSWRTLPYQFHLVRIELAPGKQSLECRAVNIAGQVVSLPAVEVDLKVGEKKVLPIYISK